MGLVMRDLPTENGSIIAWHQFYDGADLYNCAILSYDDGIDEDGDPGFVLRWWRAGFHDSMATEELQALLRDNWTYVGKVEAKDLL